MKKYIAILLAAMMMLAMLAATVFLVVSIIYVTQSLSPLEDALNCAAAAALLACAVWFYRPLLRPKQETMDTNGLPQAKKPNSIVPIVFIILLR